MNGRSDTSLDPAPAPALAQALAPAPSGTAYFTISLLVERAGYTNCRS